MAASPVDLALFRIAVALNVLLAPELADALRWAELPTALWQDASGALAFARTGVAHALLGVVKVAAVAALVGWQSRIACGVAALLCGVLFALPQRAGYVIHTHHLVWFLTLCAASPSGAALSVDAVLRARRDARAGLAFAASRPDPRCGAAILGAWLLIGAIYFFPGAWKLLASDGAWLDGSALRGHLWWKWLEEGATPDLRLDRSPPLCAAAGVAIVAFELGFVALVFTRLRGAAVAAALVFHALTARFVGIHFSSLWTTYGVFFDGGLVLASVGAWVAPRGIAVAYAEDGGRRHVRCAGLRALDVLAIGRYRVTVRGGRAARRASPSWRAPALVAAGLLVGAVGAGALGATRGWPFACYPTFHRAPPPFAPALVIEAALPDGSTHVVPHGPDLTADRKQRAWGLVRSLLEAESAAGDPDRERLTAYVRELVLVDPRAAAQARGATELRLWQELRAVDPDRREPPARRLLFTLPLDPEGAITPARAAR